MYLHDLCRFDSTSTRSQSPSGPAITPQNEVWNRRISGGKAVERNKPNITAA